MKNVIDMERSLIKAPQKFELQKVVLDRMSKNYLPFKNEHAAMARKNAIRRERKSGDYLLQFGRK